MHYPTIAWCWPHIYNNQQKFPHSTKGTRTHIHVNFSLVGCRRGWVLYGLHHRYNHTAYWLNIHVATLQDCRKQNCSVGTCLKSYHHAHSTFDHTTLPWDKIQSAVLLCGGNAFSECNVLHYIALMYIICIRACHCVFFLEVPHIHHAHDACRVHKLSMWLKDTTA